MVSMALPDLTELRRRTYAQLRDSESAFVTQASVDQWLNEAYLDLNARLRVKRSEVSGTSTASGTITLPDGDPDPSVVEIISLWFGSDGVTFTDDYTFSWYANQSNSTGDTILARIVGEVIETYPAQVSQSYTLEYIGRPAALAQTTDTPVDLTNELAIRLPWYAAAYAKYQEGEMDEGDRFMAMYLEGLPGRPRSLYRKRPGTMTLTPEQGPLDLV